MKPSSRCSRKSAFSLVEMVGVLAIMSILVTILMPRVFSAIHESRLNNALSNCHAVRSGAVSYFGKYGRFGGLNGALETNSVTTHYDREVLIPEGFLERTFAPRLGDGGYVQLVDGLGRGISPSEANCAYNLDNKPSFNTNDAYGHKVLEAILVNVTKAEAWEMSWRVDGAEGTLTNKLSNQDLVGRVKYNITGATGNVRIYLVHK